VTIQREVLDLIAQLVAEDGMALLLISHDLGVMAENVDRLLVMYGGTVVEAGPTEQVFQQRAHPYTRGLFAARPQLGLRAAAGAGRRHRLVTIPGRVPELIDLPAGCGFGERCSLAQDACRTGPPPAVQITPDHLARCLRLDAARELP
jgi:peptide/nickel transport system ATP-binding protein